MQAVVVAEVAEQEEEEREVLDMATRAHRAPISEQQRGIPAGKPQKAPPGANRKALGDIGNLVNAAKTQQEEAKPPLPITRPVTRSFGALLLKNAQSTAECAVNIKKPAKPEAAVGGAKAAAPPKQAKSNVPAAAEDVEKKAAESSLEKRKSSRKKAYSFSSVLSARSKAACGISLQQDEIIPSIDASDVGDPLKVVAYVEDIYQFYKDSEGACTLSDYMGSQIEINAKMRSILVDWLIEVHYKFELMPETLYLTVYIMDRFLSLESVLRRELQLVGMTALLIACKYEEIWAPEVHDFMCVSDNAYSRQQILCKEKKILEKLGWNLTVPTPYVFLVRFLKAASAASDSSEMENLTFFFAELGLMQYSSMIGHCPSMAAAAAVYAARCTMKKSPLWTEELKRHTGFAEEEVREKARALVELHQAAPESKLKSTFKKYSSQNLGSVASFPVAKQLTERSSSSSCSS